MTHVQKYTCVQDFNRVHSPTLHKPDLGGKQSEFESRQHLQFLEAMLLANFPSRLHPQ